MRTVRHRFDYFCKKILHGEKVNYEREMENRAKHEISISQLTQEELGKLNSMDDCTIKIYLLFLLKRVNLSPFHPYPNCKVQKRRFFLKKQQFLAYYDRNCCFLIYNYQTQLIIFKICFILSPSYYIIKPPFLQIFTAKGVLRGNKYRAGDYHLLLLCKEYYFLLLIYNISLFSKFIYAFSYTKYTQNNTTIHFLPKQTF